MQELARQRDEEQALELAATHLAGLDEAEKQQLFESIRQELLQRAPAAATWPEEVMQTTVLANARKRILHEIWPRLDHDAAGQPAPEAGPGPISLADTE